MMKKKKSEENLGGGYGHNVVFFCPVGSRRGK
jgi:GT2 family glycosyltransferase